jgi:hypothetical protein
VTPAADQRSARDVEAIGVTWLGTVGVLLGEGSNRECLSGHDNSTDERAEQDQKANGAESDSA